MGIISETVGHAPNCSGTISGTLGHAPNFSVTIWGTFFCTRNSGQLFRELFFVPENRVNYFVNFLHFRNFPKTSVLAETSLQKVKMLDLGKSYPVHFRVSKK